MPQPEVVEEFEDALEDWAHEYETSLLEALEGQDSPEEDDDGKTLNLEETR